ncbi:MAG: DUF2723 domain-containing protein [Candidatus Baltobacteraceae bacterium]
MHGTRASLGFGTHGLPVRGARPAAALIVGLVSAAVFVLSVQHDVGFWDTGEMQTIPYILGIGHPTGYPTFILAGWLFAHAFAVGPVFWRINLMCALAYAGAATLLCDFIWHETRRLVVAVGIALAYAFGALTWDHAVHADVFALTVLSAALALRLVQAWIASGNARYLTAAAFVLGLSLGTHLTIVWTIPGIAVYALARRQPWSVGRTAQCLAGFALGALVYIYLPLASAANFAARKDPLLALGVPPGRQFWDYAHPATWSNFVWLVGGGQVDTSSHLVAMLHPQTYVSGRLVDVLRLLVEGYPLWLVALAVVGFAAALRARGGWYAFGLALAAVGPLPFSISFTPETEPGRYWLVPCWILAALAGIGAGRLFEHLERFNRPAPVAAAVALAALIAAENVAGASRYARAYDHPGLTYIADVDRFIADGAIVVAPWVLATPLGYAAYVSHAFGNRILDVGTPDGEARYLAVWLKARRAYVVDYVTPHLTGINAKYVGRAHLAPQVDADAKIWELKTTPSH